MILTPNMSQLAKKEQSWFYWQLRTRDWTCTDTKTNYKQNKLQNKQITKQNQLQSKHNYTTKPITKQNQLHNKINYSTKPSTNCTNSEPTQQQINSMPTQNQFNTNSKSSQCFYHHCQLNPNSTQSQENQSNSINYTLSNMSYLHNIKSQDLCRCMRGLSWKCMLADITEVLGSDNGVEEDKDQQKQTVQIDRRNKLHKYKYKYQCQVNSMSHSRKGTPIKLSRIEFNHHHPWTSGGPNCPMKSKCYWRDLETDNWINTPLLL